MKKILILSIFFCSTVATIVLFGRKPRIQFKKELKHSLQNMKHVRHVINSAVAAYGHDPKFLVELLSQEDDEGWSLLTHYIMHHDIQDLEKMMDLFEDQGKEIELDLADLFSQTSKKSYSPLHLAVLRHDEYTVQRLLELAKQFFGHHPEAFARFLNTRDNDRGQTPLILAAYNDDIEIVKHIVRVVDEVIGPDRPEYAMIINAEDFFGNTAYNYAQSIGRKYLRKHGAEVTERFSKRV